MALSLDDAKVKMQASIEHLHEQLKKVRTGRASAAMLDSVVVNAYGTPTPLKHVANVVASDAQMLTVTPFDPNNLPVISSAISESNLGLNPSDDGRIVRVPVPPLNEERRKELVKQLGATTEDAKVVLRTIRHDVLDTAKEQKKAGEISEDDLARTEKQVEEYMADFQKQIDAAFDAKQAEIMTV